MDGGSQHCTGGGDQNHPPEKEMQKGGEWLSQGASQITEKRREQLPDVQKVKEKRKEIPI